MRKALVSLLVAMTLTVGGGVATAGEKLYVVHCENYPPTGTYTSAPLSKELAKSLADAIETRFPESQCKVSKA